MSEQGSGGVAAAPPTSGPAGGPAEEPAASRRRGTAKPGWLPFWTVLTVLALLVGTSTTLGVLAPDRAEGSVGFYERVTLTLDDDGRTALAGFIAPEGWLRDAPDPDGPDEVVEAGSEDDEGVRTSAGFASPSGDLRLDATLRSSAGGADELLRGSAPPGAALAPVRAVDTGSGYETRMIEYDLEAGAGVTQRFAVCATGRAEHCLLFEVVVPGADRDPFAVDPAVAAVLGSAEVF